MGSSLNTPPFLLGTIRPRRLMSQEAPPRVTGVPAAPSECVYFCRQPCGAGETGRLPLTFAPALFQPDRAGWECLLGCATRSSHLVLKPPAASARPAPRGDFPVPAAPGGRAAGVRPAPKVGAALLLLPPPRTGAPGLLARCAFLGGLRGGAATAHPRRRRQEEPPAAPGALGAVAWGRPRAPRISGGAAHPAPASSGTPSRARAGPARAPSSGFRRPEAAAPRESSGRSAASGARSRRPCGLRARPAAPLPRGFALQGEAGGVRGHRVPGPGRGGLGSVPRGPCAGSGWGPPGWPPLRAPSGPTGVARARTPGLGVEAADGGAGPPRQPAEGEGRREPGTRLGPPLCSDRRGAGALEGPRSDGLLALLSSCKRVWESKGEGSGRFSSSTLEKFRRNPSSRHGRIRANKQAPGGGGGGGGGGRTCGVACPERSG